MIKGQFCAMKNYPFSDWWPGHSDPIAMLLYFAIQDEVIVGTVRKRFKMVNPTDLRPQS